MKKKRKLTKAQLEILFDCWKNGSNTKEWLELIEKNLPKVPSLIALSVMRSMAKTDDQWKKVLIRRNNKKEKEKQEKQIEKEKKKAAVIQKKQEREKKREEKNKIKSFKEKINNIRCNLKLDKTKEIQEKIESEYFFCSEIDQYVNNISCIYRIFSDEYRILLDSKCEKCLKMNKYIPVLEEITNDRPQKIRRHRTGKNGGKVKEENAVTSESSGETPSNP